MGRVNAKLEPRARTDALLVEREIPAPVEGAVALPIDGPSPTGVPVTGVQVGTATGGKVTRGTGLGVTPVSKMPVLLGIGLPRGLVLDGMEIRRPANDRAVVELLRQTDFDLMLVSAAAEEEKVWNLMRLVRRHWPGLRWVLFSEDCTDSLEILARSLGAICVTADRQTIEELATT